MKEDSITCTLKYLLEEADNRLLRGDLSDRELASLSRVYIAVHNLLVVNNLEGKSGSRELYRQRIRELYGMCRARCADRRLDITERMSLIYTLYRLLLAPVLCTVDREEQRQCDTLAYEAVTEYLQKCSSGQWKETSESEFEVCRLITELCCDLSEEEREEEDMMLYFHRKLTAWTDGLAHGNHWPDLPYRAALQRLLILCRNACLFLDASRDGQICRLWEYYHKHISLSSEKTASHYALLALLYEINASGGLSTAEQPFSHSITEIMRQAPGIFPEGSEERLFCLSWAVEGIVRYKISF